MRIALLITLLFVACSTAVAQQDFSVGTSTWSVTSATNKADSSSFSYTCQFINTGVSSLSWVQAGGSKVYDYAVNSVTGSWPDINQDGQISLSVSDGTVTGTVVFSRINAQYSVHLTLLVNGAVNQDYVFTVSSVTSSR